MEHYEMKRQVDQARKHNKEKFKQNSKERLIKIVGKHCTTAMIGTLARLEETLGDVWGHGESNLTEEQEYMQHVWSELREDILDHCNGQKRAIVEEINQHTITWNRYKTEFIVKNPN